MEKNKLITILIVDDEKNCLYCLGEFGKTVNFDTYTANCGKKALETLEKYSGIIDVVLLDVKMPGMSGHELYQLINCALPAHSAACFFLVMAQKKARSKLFIFKNQSNPKRSFKKSETPLNKCPLFRKKDPAELSMQGL